MHGVDFGAFRFAIRRQFVWRNNGGKTFYHAGDTGLFYDMKLIGEMNTIDLAALPIGDNFTMGIDDAVVATEYIKPHKVIPMHFLDEFRWIDFDDIERIIVHGNRLSRL